MDPVQKSVREYLRAADIILDQLKISENSLTEHEMTMLMGYTTRIQSFLREVKQSQEPKT